MEGVEGNFMYASYSTGTYSVLYILSDAGGGE